jgi:dTMP kinase
MIISFEGLDGCGKSTQISKLCEALNKSGKEYSLLREPGGNSISEMLRTILLDRKNLQMADITEFLLYIASRAQLVSEEIIPLAEKDRIVIMDRYVDSTMAYQGYGRDLDKGLIKQMNNFVTRSGKYMPEITFYLDMDAERSLERVRSRGEEINRMESLDIDFFEKVRKGFIEISRNEPGRVFVVNASLDPCGVFAQIEKILKMRNVL